MSDQADRLRQLIRQLKERDHQAQEHWTIGQRVLEGKQEQVAEHILKEEMEGNSAEQETRVIAVASGKGGVGKTNFVLNFALALRKLGRRVVIWDADFGFSNLHVLMGKTPSVTLLSLLEKELDIWQAVTQGIEGVEYISSGQGIRELFSLTDEKLNYFLSQFMQLRTYADYLLIDLGAGLTSHSMSVILAADELILLATPEPTSMTDAYALLKLLSMKDRHLNGHLRVHLLVNRAKSEREGLAVQQRMATVTERFLSIRLHMLGILPDDDHVVKAVLRQQPYLLAYPKSAVARKTMELAERFIDSEASAQTLENETSRVGFWRRFRQMFQSVSSISHGKR